MKLVEIKKNENGGHDNVTTDYVVDIPEGWAVIPDDMDTPNFPFGDVAVRDFDGVMTVVKWTPGTIPEPTPYEEPITEAEQLRADIDYLAVMMGVTL